MGSASDSEFGGPGSVSRAGHLLDLFAVVLSSKPRPHLHVVPETVETIS